MVDEKNSSNEVEEEIKILICQVCIKETNPEDYNEYYGACHTCVDGGGRIGT